MAHKKIYAGCIVTLSLVWGCTTQTATNPPPPAITPEAESEFAGTDEMSTEPETETSTEIAPDGAGGTGEPVKVTDADFEKQVLQSSKVVMVDLWAAWCPPCRQLAPIVDELAAEYQGRVVVAKLDFDDNPETPKEYDVTGLPTLLFFKDGQLVERLVGAHPKQQIARVLDSLLKS